MYISSSFLPLFSRTWPGLTGFYFLHFRQFLKRMRNSMKILFAIFLLIDFCSSAYSQIGLTQKLKNADTLLLVSHSMTSRSTNIMVDSKGQAIPSPDLLANGSLNEKIIVERKVLNKKETEALIKILTPIK